MSIFKLHRLLPNDKDYHLFDDFIKKLYEPNSQRFLRGNDPVETYLEGCYVLQKGDETVGRFALYENPNLKYKDQLACCLGSYECAKDSEISHELLSSATKRAKELGYSYLIGPMEGSTWNNYRFSDHNKYPNFFMEPFHHAYYSDQFKEFGFSIIAEYVSNLDEEVTVPEKDIDAFEEYYKARGAQFRFLCLNDLENDLHKIARFSNDAFQHNFLFTPINEDEFVAKYLRIKNYFDPALVMIVEDENDEIEALSFSIKDFNESRGKSLIIKSLARRNDSKLRGIGAYLIQKTYQLARANGYDNVIHALMIKDNASKKISENYHGSDYKSYSLFGMEI